MTQPAKPSFDWVTFHHFPTTQNFEESGYEPIHKRLCADGAFQAVFVPLMPPPLSNCVDVFTDTNVSDRLQKIPRNRCDVNSKKDRAQDQK